MDREKMLIEYDTILNDFLGKMADIDKRYGTYARCSFKDIDVTFFASRFRGWLREIFVEDIVVLIDGGDNNESIN